VKKSDAAVVFAIIFATFFISLALYYINLRNNALKYLTDFSQLVDSYIENKIGLVSYFSEDLKVDDTDYSKILKLGPNTYLKGIKSKELSIKYVLEKEGKSILLEIPLSTLKFPSHQFTVKLISDGKVTYSNDTIFIGTFDKVLNNGLLHQTKTTKSGFTAKIIPKSDVILSELPMTLFWGIVPLTALVFLNRKYINEERDLEHSTSALLSIISDMVLRVETGEHVEYRAINTRHVPLVKIQQAIQDLFSRYTEAIEGYKFTTEELENTMSQIEEMQSALEERNFLLINTLAETVELKDVGTGEHSKRVMQLSLGLATKLKIVDPEELNAIKYGAILHDVGKIGIPDQILLKPGKLSIEEFEIMKGHTILGERVVSQIPGWELVADFVRHHHENVDGSGYPDGLSKESLSLRAQIVALVDVYIALTEHRPYRNALTSAEALKLMETMVGTKFDKELFDKFEEMILEREKSQNIYNDFDLENAEGGVIYEKSEVFTHTRNSFLYFVYSNIPS